MAFRGRGRGQGRGRGGFFDTRKAKHEAYKDFPEDVSLPSLPSLDRLSNEEKDLITWKLRLELFWKGSAYHLEATAPKSKLQDVEIERFSDSYKRKTSTRREALASYLKLIPSNFPPELIQGSRRVQHDSKKLRWDRDPDQKLDFFEKLDEKYKGQGERGEIEKKGESEDEEEEQEEEEKESSDDGDYAQNIDFDDDEDDLNMEEEEHEDIYE